MELIKMIKNSILSPHGKESSTRIATYVILFLVIIFAVTFLGIEIFTIIKIETVETISNEAVMLFGMLLSHHLLLLGINKHNETKIKIAETQNKPTEIAKPTVTTETPTTEAIDEGPEI